jgi:hypothetical protein
MPYPHPHDLTVSSVLATHAHALARCRHRPWLLHVALSDLTMRREPLRPERTWLGRFPHGMNPLWNRPSCLWHATNHMLI